MYWFREYGERRRTDKSSGKGKGAGNRDGRRDRDHQHCGAPSRPRHPLSVRSTRAACRGDKLVVRIFPPYPRNLSITRSGFPVSSSAREAAAAGASREKIAAILARADEAKKHVAEATERLREAISEILDVGEPPCFVLISPTGSLRS